jgi:autotransporter-associated beta strand protein
MCIPTVTRCAPLISRCSLVALVVGASFLSESLASDHTWRGYLSTTNRNWGTAANWSPNGTPPSDLANTNIIFEAGGLPSSPANIRDSTLNVPWSVHSMSFSNNADSYVVNGSTLTIGAGGINHSSGSVQTFANPVVLGADQTWTMGPGVPGINFSGGVNTNGGPGNLPRTVTIRSAVFNNAVPQVINGSITGGGALIKTDRGFAALAGGNTYTGGTTITGGTLRLDNFFALGLSGPITMSGGVLRYSANNSQDYSSRFSSAPGQAFNIDTNGQFVLYNTGTNNSSSRLAKLGAGELRLNQANTFSNVSVEGGTLSVSGGITAEFVDVSAGTLSVAGNITSRRIFARPGTTLNSSPAPSSRSQVSASYFYMAMWRVAALPPPWSRVMPASPWPTSTSDAMARRRSPKPVAPSRPATSSATGLVPPPRSSWALATAAQAPIISAVARLPTLSAHKSVAMVIRSASSTRPAAHTARRSCD